MNWYIDPIKNKYADFTGRASRQEYWMFFLINVIISVVIWLIDMMLTGGFIYALYAVAVLVPSLAIGARRLHDIGKSGWMLLIGLIPIVGLILLYFLAQPGEPDTNAYGPPPGQARTEPGLA